MNTETQTHTLTLPWVEAATKHFVYADEMREAFSLAMAVGLNAIFSGPGGHGKSEFLMAAIGAIGDVRQVFRVRYLSGGALWWSRPRCPESSGWRGKGCHSVQS